MSLTEHMTGLQHIGVPTNDLEATVRFYTALGFAVRLRAGTESEPVVFLQMKNIMIETYQNGRAAGRAGAIDHVAIDVDDIGAAYEAVRALGFAELENGVQSLPFWERGVRFFTIAGPNGEKVEFSQRL